MSLIEDFMLKNKVLANTIWAVYVGSNLLENTKRALRLQRPLCDGLQWKLWGCIGENEARSIPDREYRKVWGS